MAIRVLRTWSVLVAIAVIALLVPFATSTAEADHSPEEPYLAQPVLFTDDMEAMVRFYRLLDFKVINYEPREGEPFWVSMYTKNEDGLINRISFADYQAFRDFNPKVRQVRNSPLHEFEVMRAVFHEQDVDRYVAILRSAGHEIVREPAERPWNEYDAYSVDPEGNLVHISTHLDIFPPCPDDCPIYTN